MMDVINIHGPNNIANGLRELANAIDAGRLDSYGTKDNRELEDWRSYRLDKVPNPLQLGKFVDYEIKLRIKDEPMQPTITALPEGTVLVNLEGAGGQEEKNNEGNMAPECESYLNGWRRHGREVTVGNGVYCAGCGKDHGCFTVDLTGYTAADFPKEAPHWPFKEADCPVCINYTETDKLTARLIALKTKPVPPAPSSESQAAELQTLLINSFPSCRPPPPGGLYEWAMRALESAEPEKNTTWMDESDRDHVRDTAEESGITIKHSQITGTEAALFLFYSKILGQA